MTSRTSPGPGAGRGSSRSTRGSPTPVKTIALMPSGCRPEPDPRSRRGSARAPDGPTRRRGRSALDKATGRQARERPPPDEHAGHRRVVLDAVRPDRQGIAALHTARRGDHRALPDQVIGPCSPNDSARNTSHDAGRPATDARGPPGTSTAPALRRRPGSLARVSAPLLGVPRDGRTAATEGSRMRIRRHTAVGFAAAAMGALAVGRSSRKRTEAPAAPNSTPVHLRS